MDNILLDYIQRRQMYEGSRPDGVSQDYPVVNSTRPRGLTSVSRPLASTLRHEQSGNRPGPLEGAGDVQVVVPQNRGWLDDMVRDVATSSPKKQVMIGGVSGLASGYIVGKVGRAALLAVGGSIILLQIAHYQGLIQVNWTNVESSVASTRRRLNDHVSDSFPGLLEDVTEFGRRHVFLAGSFFAGFLVGLAT